MRPLFLRQKPCTSSSAQEPAVAPYCSCPRHACRPGERRHQGTGCRGLPTAPTLLCKRRLIRTLHPRDMLLCGLRRGQAAPAFPAETGGECRGPSPSAARLAVSRAPGITARGAQEEDGEERNLSPGPDQRLPNACPLATSGPEQHLHFLLGNLRRRKRVEVRGTRQPVARWEGTLGPAICQAKSLSTTAPALTGPAPLPRCWPRRPPLPGGHCPAPSAPRSTQAQEALLARPSLHLSAHTWVTLIHLGSTLHPPRDPEEVLVRVPQTQPQHPHL